MNKKKLSLLFFICIFFVSAVVVLIPEESDARRRSRGKSYRSSSYSRNSGSWNRSGSAGRSVWGQRSGGGIYGIKKNKLFINKKPIPKKSSSGYSKPLNTNRGSSSGYSKPLNTNRGSSSGYSKPLNTNRGSSSGYNKPLNTNRASSSGYNKPLNQKKSGFNSNSRFDKKIAKNMKKKKAASSLAAYKAEKKKFSKADEPLKGTDNYKNNPIYNNARSYSDYNYRTHYDNRDRYYNRYNWKRPGYAYSSRSRFGMWDAFAWWMILDNLTSRRHYAMAYHHSDDPGYKEWRKEADRLAQSDSELKEKLRQLDSKVASMDGEEKDSSYLPDDMPPSVALAGDVLALKQPDKAVLRLATASQAGNYHKFGKMLKLNAEGVDVMLKNTAGSMENLMLLSNGDVDAAIVQSDSFTVYKNKFSNSELNATEQTTLYKEVVQMIANKKSGISSVKDIIPEKHVLYIGPKGSGTAMTWEGFCQQDRFYKLIRVKNASYEDALRTVITNKHAVMMFVAGLNSNFLRRAEKEAGENGTIKLVEVNDWNFNNASDSFGNSIYKFVDIPSAVYPGLQKGFLTDRDIETIAVEAILVVRTDWAEKFGPESMDSLSFAIMETQPDIARLTNGLAQ